MVEVKMQSTPINFVDISLIVSPALSTPFGPLFLASKLSSNIPHISILHQANLLNHFCWVTSAFYLAADLLIDSSWLKLFSF